MSYVLLDSNGYLAEGPSVQGLEDLATWAGSNTAVGEFIDEGFTQNLDALIASLENCGAQGSVDVSRKALLDSAKSAEDVLIISDGIVDSSQFRANTANPITGLAQTFVPKLRSTIWYAFTAGREALARTSDLSSVTDFEPGIRATQDALTELLPKLYVKLLAESGQVGFASLRTAAKALKFDSSPAVKWASSHTAELVKGISDTTRDEIKRVIAARLETGDLKSGRADLLKALGDKDRALLVAEHETTLAAHTGQRMAWAQGLKDGLLTGKEKRQWLSSPSACPECESLDGDTATLRGLYPNGLEGPPKHPRCQCSEELI